MAAHLGEPCAAVNELRARAVRSGIRIDQGSKLRQVCTAWMSDDHDSAWADDSGQLGRNDRAEYGHSDVDTAVGDGQVGYTGHGVPCGVVTAGCCCYGRFGDVDTLDRRRGDEPSVPALAASNVKH